MPQRLAERCCGREQSAGSQDSVKEDSLCNDEVCCVPVSPQEDQVTIEEDDQIDEDESDRIHM